ncbi:amidohydrolase family protein [Carboxylicivirga sediminis]|uniref:Amidohydrolase family protein n=1 Tax=Carboxylicivirga sediminis TaxID=2006564 RepID=A0A941F3G9_9BACT|nr:amidohydrolase family protein [Carboxylicivirga sediminis]MBR8536091.1 amidohydrolase family protein [Carboxylicivirga sediminis]
MKVKVVTLRLSVLMLVVMSFSAHAQDESVTLITNVNIFDGVNEKLLEGYDVLVVKNLIKKIDKNIKIADAYEIDVKTGGLKAMPGAYANDFSDRGEKTVMVYEPEKNTKKKVKVTKIDGEGRTLIPGLIDAHWHTTYAYTPATILLANRGDMAEVAIISMKGAEETLLRGFTTVRDMGGNPFAIKKLIDAGEFPGHRILPSGPFMSPTAGHADFYSKLDSPRDKNIMSYWERNMMGMTSDGVAEVQLRTRDILRYGATQIKICTGGGVSSVYDPLDVSEYSIAEVKAAVEEATNYNTYVASHVMTDRGVRASVEAGVMCIEHGFFASDETLKLMKEKGAWLSPQAMKEEDMVWANPISAAKYKQVTDAVADLYPRAKKFGVNIAFGTDQLLDASKAYQQSLYLVRLGEWFTPYEVLKIATSENARLLEMSGPRHPYQEGSLGVVKEGAYADLILVDGNPLKNLELVGDPEKNFVVIIKDGKVYKNTTK